MSNELITVENCTELTKQVEHIGDVNSKASAWHIVFEYCLQEGMETNKWSNKFSGVQRVIHFIEELKKQHHE